MTTDPERPALPGLEPADGRTRPLDTSQDPDRFVPEEHPRVVEPAPRDDALPPVVASLPTSPPTSPPTSRRLGAADDPDRFDPDAAPELPRGLDPAYDPDRFRPPGQGQTLTDLLGKEGSHQGERDGYQWVAGLLGVFLFLALVAWLFNSVLTP
jgi:hypothetical protein